jgi:hypothetical protein
MVNNEVGDVVPIPTLPSFLIVSNSVPDPKSPFWK